MTNHEKIPFSIEISRVIELLTKQIYPSPFALLRENVQNSFDAILLRKHRGQKFEPKIEITIEQNRVQVTDNGIGMSRNDLRTHFWRAGSSSKNTDEARSAGVVGTFGIGAMANFGIADELLVTTESATTGERTTCAARRSTLSVTEDCIEFNTEEAQQKPGTTVVAIMQAEHPVDVEAAKKFIASFVSFLPIAVYLNGELVSKRAFESAVPKLTESWSKNGVAKDFGGGLVADFELGGAITGEVRIDLKNLVYGGQKLGGRLILRQGLGTLQTFRSSFGLATASFSSAYSFGGVADFLFLEPTAGREALTTPSMQLLQQIITAVENHVSELLAGRPESNASSPFVNWAHRHKRYDLCSYLRARVEPGDSEVLYNIKKLSERKPVLIYSGNDAATIKHASEDRPIVMLSRAADRRQCELGYLQAFCKIEVLSDEPKVLTKKPSAEHTLAERAVIFRLASILSSDYFLETEIKFAKISHGLPMLIEQSKPVKIFLDPEAASLQVIIRIFDTEYSVFDHVTKDYIRTNIFPRISTLVPSATRQGAEAFLKTIQRNRDVFEYERSDLEKLASLWEDYVGGRLTFPEATQRSQAITTRSYQIIDHSTSASVRAVVPDVTPDVPDPDNIDSDNQSRPPIERLEIETEHKLLTIDESEPPLNGYRCFLALSDRIKDRFGEFFLQPHKTAIVWGGQKALFIFEHHSGKFGLYYDIQTQAPLSEKSGGGSFPTSTIVMKNRTFIPIPDSIKENFLPEENEKKRLEVRCDILHIDQPSDD